MDLIDVHNTIDTMRFSSFVADYMYDDDFRDMCDEAHIGPSEFLEQKIGEALDPIRSLELDDYSKDYSHMFAAKDNLSMLLIDYYRVPALDEDNPEQDFVWAMNGWLDGLISDCDHDSEINGIITQAYVIEDFKRDFFTACSKEEMADTLYHRLSDFFSNKEAYLNFASIEGLFPEGVFDKLKDMDDDPYTYYDYQMSGAVDDNYTGASVDDKSKQFNLEYYIDGLRSIVGDGIKKAFRAAGDDRGYGYLLSGAIANARQKHLTPENTVKCVQKCGVANIIYNSVWVGMNGEPIQTMKGLGYSRLMSSADVQRYDISDGLAEKVVNRFCKNKEAAQVFKNINDGTQDLFGGPQENQVRKELNVPADDKELEDESEKEF